MLHFHHPDRLWALLLLPALAAVLYAAARWETARFKALADARLLRVLWTDGAKHRERPLLRSVLLLLAVGCTVLGWAGPYSPKGGSTTHTSTVDVIVALDASRSMRATDLQPDRLRRAVAFINRLAERLPDDRMGLVVFAGRAYLQVPLTTDRAAYRMALADVAPEDLPAQGTVLSAAINLAAESFSQKERRARALVLVTDGENHDDDTKASVDAAAGRSITIFSVGVGSPEGAPLYTEPGQPKLDAGGNPVVSRLDEKGLQETAVKTGGNYIRLRDAAATAGSVAAAIREGATPATSAESTASRQEYFPYLLLAAFLLFIAAQLRTTLRRLPQAAVLLLLLLARNPAAAQTRFLRDGDAAYRAGRWADAAAAYKKALADTTTRATAQYNLGNALYRLGQFGEAQKAFEAARQEQHRNGTAAYNEGNAQASQKEWEAAVQSYRQALRAAPGSADAQYNLSYALKHLKKQQQDQKKDPKNQPQQKPQPGQQPPAQDPQPQPGGMDKKEAEKLLQALRNEEKKVRARQRNGNGDEAQPEKDW